MISKAIACGAALLLPLMMSASVAQESGNRVDEIVVTSSRIPLPLRQIGTSVSVITAEDIEAQGNPSLVNILRQSPAVGSSNSGGTGKLTTLRIRGEEGYRTLVLFDGMRLLDPSAPDVQPDFAHLLSSGIGRVEILRGPQGLAYGADAGGVVNITTRRQTEGVYAGFDVLSGDFSTRQLNANLAGKAGQWDYFLSATDFSSAGFNARPSDSVLQDDDGYDNTSLHGRLGFAFNQRWRMDVAHRDTSAESEYDGCFDAITFNTVYDCTSEYDQAASQISTDYQSETSSHRLAWFTVDVDHQDFSLGLPAFGSEGELERLEYVGSLTGLPGLNLAFGADLEEQTNGSTSRDNKGIFLEYLSDFSESFFVTAGIRHDDNEDFGTHDSYRISSAYLISTGDNSLLKFRAAWGTGRTAPSPYQSEYNASAAAYPPASLVSLDDPEFSRGWEFGIEYDVGNTLHLEAVYFDQEVEDDIYFDLVTFSGYLQEAGTTTSEGIELVADFALTDNLSVFGNFTYNNAEQPDGTQRIRRPEKLANLGVSYRALNDRLSFNGFYRSSSDAIDEIFGVGYVPLDDFNVVDMNVSFRLTDTMSVYGRVENATDEEYMEIVDFNTPGRAWYVGIRLRF